LRVVDERPQRASASAAFPERLHMNVRPLRDRILVERLEETEQRVGGIIIPDSAREKPTHAKVIAVGRGRVNDDGQVFALDVKVGDTVLLGKYSGSEITVAGKDYVILREEEVLGVVEGVAEMAMA
jgi:chaperonin GroES